MADWSALRSETAACFFVNPEKANFKAFLGVFKQAAETMFGFLSAASLTSSRSFVYMLTLPISDREGSKK
jgi:hypothetical protein